MSVLLTEYHESCFKMNCDLNLSPSEIESLDKSVVLSKLHHLIRMWFIDKVLPKTWLEDSEIIPYFTPCNGHLRDLKSESDSCDEIDGFFPMQAYCLQCKNEKS